MQAPAGVPALHESGHFGHRPATQVDAGTTNRRSS